MPNRSEQTADNSIEQSLSRRALLSGAGLSAAACAVAAAPVAIARGASDSTAKSASNDANPFRFGMNTSTLRGQKLPITELVEVVAKAGFQAIEPWISELDDHAHRGGSLKDLGKKIRDLGLTVESSIGFTEWVVDDDARRAKALEHVRRDMDTVAQVGGLRMAAPPAGATDVSHLDSARIAERYGKLLELGDQIGVVPEVEVWGFSKTLTRLSDAAEVALMVGHPKACILPDIYHLYKGGSPFAGLRLLSGQAVHVIHANDYPANPPRATIKDSDRVFPGDGVAPLAVIFRDLRDAGFRGTLSIELFNPTYWQQDPHTVARTALAKTRAIVADALAIK